jgi:3-deoxy-D-manno-octulosonic-acid transferase
VINGYDIAYGIGLAASVPVWLIRPSVRRKVLKALRERMGHAPARAGNTQAILIHAVSLGEMNATRALVSTLSDQHPELQFIISTTTTTGYDRGRELYGSNQRVTLIRYPLDFTAAIARVLDGLRPAVVVLMELEAWPNFVLQCERRGIPVLLINGRLTAGSFRNYRLGAALVRRMFRRITLICAQEKNYADRFIALGAPRDRVQITGTMKFDTAQIADTIAGADELASSVGLRPGEEAIWVCGSTGPGEEEILLRIYRTLLERHPRLRLILVPRKPERFNEVAEIIRGDAFELVRRSQHQIATRKSQISNLESQISNLKSEIDNPSPPVILGDTMGELRKFYSLADVVFVGRTLVDLGSRQHGSDMIEPAALAKATVVGHFTGNFAEVMNHFRSSDAMREVTTPDELAAAVDAFLKDQEAARAMGNRARDVVRREQGATARHASLILKHLDLVGQRPSANLV